MDDYIWKNRPLLTFASSADAPIFSAQRAALSDRPGELVDRDIVLIEIAADRVTVDGHGAPALEASELRDRYGVGEGETAVLLVGKDGGVKIRQARALSAATLFGTIDAMPMRQREMRERP